MAQKREFVVDMHVHSKYSGESLAEPRDIIESALEKGLDAICVTEHESLHASSPFERLPTHGLVILRGVELSTDAGHMLVYGVDDDSWHDWGKDMVCHAQELIERVLRLGGVVVPAHPCVVGDSLYESFLSFSPEVKFDERVSHLTSIAAIEVCNGKHLRFPKACKMLGNVAKSMGLPGTGGSDAHLPDQVGSAYTVFKTPVYSNRSLVEAILEGLIYPRMGTFAPAPPAAHISAM